SETGNRPRRTYGASAFPVNENRHGGTPVLPEAPVSGVPGRSRPRGRRARRPVVPEAVEALVRRVPDADRLAGAPGRGVRLVRVPYLRRRALEADHVLRLRGRRPGSEEAPREAQPAPVPDLAERPRPGLAVSGRDRADVVLPVERAAAGRHAAVAVDHRL